MQKNKIKSAKEIKYLTKSAKTTKGIFDRISKKIKPGVREKEIADQIDNRIKEKGLSRSFKTIVASGPNAARPHAKTSRRAIGKNDIVVVDFGVIYKGYHSDMTRTVIIGKISPRMRRLYKTVEAAQKMAIKKVRAGLRISDFVSDVYNYIRKKGLGKHILHSLGHGVGTRVHEAPRLSEKNSRVLKKCMVVTIEPGLYIKGKSGVRIEDMICVNDGKARMLTK